MSSCTASTPSSFSTFFKQSVFLLCVTAWSHISLQKLLLSSSSGITLSLCTPSNSLNNLFWFDSNNRFWMNCFVILSYLSSFAPKQLTSVELLREPLQHVSFLHWTFFQALIWRLHFAIPLVSFYLIILTLCIIPFASLKFFFANLVVCLLSSPCFCNPSSQQQYCQQQVIP